MPDLMESMQPRLDRRHRAGGELSRLAARARRGDHEAFAALYEALAPEVAAHVRLRCPDGAMATSVVYATFVEVWRLLRFHGGASDNVRAWVLCIVEERLTEQGSAGTARTGASRLTGTAHRPTGVRRVSDRARPDHWWEAVNAVHDRCREIELLAVISRANRRR